MNRTRSFVTTVAAIILAVLIPANAAPARGIFGSGQSQLTAEWWQWVLSIPPSVNPLLDTTGDQCMVGQHGSTFFLAGSWVSGQITRDCDIPQTAALFFPVINEINFDTPNQCGQGAALPSSFYRSLSKAYVDGAANLSVTLDGQPAGPMRRMTSPVFEVALPDSLKAAKPGVATLGIRPEHVGVALGGKGEVELPVRLVEPLGKDTLLYFESGSERAFVAVTEGLGMAEINVGARVALSLDQRRIHLFDADGRRIGGAQ